uniref:Ribonuclease H-like domain-containing protein n=1 Tax=Tanacetum cinerariifolium TaxID=118510 RepID=A0A6L2N4C1_TANCI|nr:ribonuclease H-like domain-containing protein [Tanacetum cinerariifolium]
MPNVDIPQGIDTGGSPRHQETIGGTPAHTRSKRVLEQPNDPPFLEGHTSGNGDGRLEENIELTDVVPKPHDSPLTSGYTPRSDEGRITLAELMETCTTLTNRVTQLENELSTTKVIYSKAFITLTNRVKNEQGEVQETAEHSRDDDDEATKEEMKCLKESSQSDVIEYGNSFKLVHRTTANADGTSTLTIPGLVTAEEKDQKKNDVKARSMLLMALPNEHLLTFGQYKDAKTLFEAIQARFGGNDATKKTQRTLLKQMYENFNAPSTESLDSIFNRLDATVYAFLANQPNGSQLVHEDLEKIHKDDLEEMDLKWQLALLSMRARRYFHRTGKKITINGSDTAGYDKTKVECFNCYKMGHFAKECRSPRNQESRPKNQDSSRKTVNVEDTSPKLWWPLVKQVLIGATWLIIKFQPTWLLWLSQTQSRTGLGFTSDNAVAPPPTGLLAPPTIDLSNSGLEEFQHPKFKGYGPKNSKSVCVDTSNEIKKVFDAPIIED